MARSITEIKEIESKLLIAAPAMQKQIKRLAAIAREGIEPTSYVAVTDNRGRRRVMPVDEYTRMSATDLAHVSIQVLDETAARGILDA